jgi:DNA primase
MDTVGEIENICRTHDIRDVLSLPSNKKVVVCPLPQHIHRNNTPSFSIFWKDGKQWWRCHGSCNTEGDVVDLVGYLRIAGYRRYRLAMRQEAARLLDDRFQIRILIPEPENRLAGDEWIQFLPASEATLSYANTRGLTPETLNRFRIGTYSSYMTMPCFEDSQLTGVKLRNTIACQSKNRFWQWPGSRQGLFNLDGVRYATEVVFVVKGEIPCMLLSQMGYKACAPTGGEGGWTERWRTALALAKRVVIGDNDAPGKKLADKRGLLLNAHVVFPPENFKDIDEYILAEPREAAAQLARWKEQDAEIY